MKNYIIEWFDSIINFISLLGPLAGIFMILLEALVPILPLTIFVAINMKAFGIFFGIIISWLAAVLGSVIVFYIFRLGLNKKVKNRKKINNMISKVNNMKLRHLAVVMALPFTPSFAINIVGGLSDISIYKFVLAALIGKIFMVYFWGYIGYNLIEVLNNPEAILQIIFMLLLAYFISKYFEKKLDLN